MKICELKHTPDDFYQDLVFERKENWDSLRERDCFHGKPIASSWTPLRVTTMVEGKDDHSKTKLPSDFPMLGTIPVFSRRAIDALKGILEPNGEILPLIFNGEIGIYYALNITRVIDALDESHSEIKRFKDGGVMLIDRYEFQADKLEGATIFKIPQQQRSRDYVTETFIASVQEAGLVGFDFKLLWTGPSPDLLSHDSFTTPLRM